ncbi:MAG: LysE family translocator [Gemmobacter sp.]|nr:LysE family translocator [Gemmobacter sp.]
MGLDGWLVFAAFWVVFVTSPGPNAVNCVGNGMAYGFKRSLWGVAAILVQAFLFLTLSAAGLAAALAAAPGAIGVLRLVGAMVLVWLGVRTVLRARVAMGAQAGAGSVFWRAFLIATLNIKSLMGYLAGFTQFVDPAVPVWDQMAVIYPTAMTLTGLSYCGYTALGAGLGRTAMAAITGVWFRQVMGVAFVIYGVALGLSG